VSKKWGFTKWNREDFEKGIADGTIVPDGNGAQARNNHGPLSAWKAQKASA
jgi:large subunit ribosomal protein L10e